MAASSPYLAPVPILSRLAPKSHAQISRETQINITQNKYRVRPKWRACSQATFTGPLEQFVNLEEALMDIFNSFTFEKSTIKHTDHS